jgi:D-alanyl-D-alanine carboxypeptidase
LPFLKEEFGFRTKFTYSNIMIILAGVVAEKLGGAPWWTLVEQRLLIPLNMTQTTTAGEADEGRGFARSYKTLEDGTLEARPWVAVR